MNRRSFLSAVVATPFLAALAACGDDQLSSGTDPTTPGTVPGSTPLTIPGTTAAAGIEHPIGADDVVLKMSYEGGFVPAGYAFVNTPTLLVSGDGRVYTQGVVPAIFPGPLLPTVLVRTITEEGIQSLLAVAQGAGLLATPADYSGGDGIADAPNTVVTLNAAGGSFVHSAYALGIDNPESPARAKLLEVATAFGDIDKAAGAANLGVDEPFVPTAYRFQARVVDPSEITGQDPAPSVVDWPATSSMSLAGATTCARLEAGAVGSLFSNAKQNTYFKDGEVVYQLAVAGVLPGDPDC
ncbi:MAG: hypothetical protein ABI862_09130 [Ilumatobacteraceae bacterium]